MPLLFTHTKFQGGRENILSVCPMKSVWYWSYRSTRTTDGNYHRKILPVHPETATEGKRQETRDDVLLDPQQRLFNHLNNF